jgi:hypothetical protein
MYSSELYLIDTEKSTELKTLIFHFAANGRRPRSTSTVPLGSGCQGLIADKTKSPVKVYEYHCGGAFQRFVFIKPIKRQDPYCIKITPSYALLIHSP